MIWWACAFLMSIGLRSPRNDFKENNNEQKIVIPTDVQNGYKGKIASLPTAL